MSALPTIDRTTNSYIPDNDGLPPLATKDKGKITYEKNPDCGAVMALLRDEATPPLRFALNRNLYVIVKIVTRKWLFFKLKKKTRFSLPNIISPCPLFFFLLKTFSMFRNCRKLLYQITDSHQLTNSCPLF